MVDHHGSQCGFCTPGFVVSMAVGHAQGRTDHDDVLAGNLCRCTGYAPIVRAAEAAAGEAVPDWIADAPPGAEPGPPPARARPGPDDAATDWGSTDPVAATGADHGADHGRTLHGAQVPRTAGAPPTSTPSPTGTRRTPRRRWWPARPMSGSG